MKAIVATLFALSLLVASPAAAKAPLWEIDIWILNLSIPSVPTLANLEHVISIKIRGCRLLGSQSALANLFGRVGLSVCKAPTLTPTSST